MKYENLEQANKLSEEIRRLELRLKVIEQFNTLSLSDGTRNNHHEMNIGYDHDDSLFAENVMEQYKKRLSDKINILKQQFEAL